MGRFFLIILGLQSFDKINVLITELYIGDLSLPYYEIMHKVEPKSTETQLCQTLGVMSTFADYMSQFYALWFAVVIQQIIKDPIHKLQKLIYFFHAITVVLALCLTLLMAKWNSFGVQVSFCFSTAI